MTQPKVLDLFAGAGGLSGGFSSEGYEILAGVDCDEDAIETFRANHDAPAIQCDLADTDPEEFFERSDVGFTSDEVHVVVGGPPCQSFSVAGHRDEDDPRSNLVHRFLDYVEHVEPQAVVMENVRGLTSMQDGDILESLLTRLDALGYSVNHEVLNAAEYGVPQLRKRLFIIGLYGRDTDPSMPTPTHVEAEPRHCLDDRVPANGE